MHLPLRTYRWRRAHTARLTELRALATSQGWTVMGLIDDLSERYIAPPLLGGLSAQAELAFGGEYRGWEVLVAYVDTRPLAREPGQTPPDSVALLCVVDVEANDREFVVSSGEGGVEVAALTPAAETSLAQLKESLAGTASAVLETGDTVAAEHDVLLLVHCVGANASHVRVMDFLTVLTDLARVMEARPRALRR